MSTSLPTSRSPALGVAALGDANYSSVAPVPRLSLSVEEACKALGISWDTWRMHVEPHVRLVRLGRRKLVPVSELQRWLTCTAETTLERR